MPSLKEGGPPYRGDAMSRPTSFWDFPHQQQRTWSSRLPPGMSPIMVARIARIAKYEFGVRALLNRTSTDYCACGVPLVTYRPRGARDR